MATIAEPRAAVSAEAAVDRGGRYVLGILVGPALLAMLAFFVLPMLWLLRVSFYRYEGSGVIAEDWQPTSYLKFLADPFYQAEAVRTVALGVGITLLTLLVSYPIALFLARSRSRWRGVLATLAVAPLLTSVVVRTYGWMVLLGNDGLVNKALLGLGLIGQPLRLLNDLSGVVVGLVEILMPYMILALLSGFGRIDPDLEEASMSLGAGPLRTFWRVTLPLSLPGVATGCLLVLVLTISSFVTPNLLGGGRIFVMATEIYQQATGTLDWPFGAAISFLLLLLFVGAIFAYTRIMTRLQALYGG